MTRPLLLAARGAVIFAAIALQACTTSTVSRGIDAEGRAGELVFPSPDNNTWVRSGTFPSVERLRDMRPGVNKEQLFDALGHPHFAEGFFGVREWDYLFNFRRPDGSVTRCQYKVIFDRALVARQFHWKPEACAGFLTVAEAVPPTPIAVERLVERPAPPAATPAAVPLAVPAPPPMFTRLSADTLFAFDRAILRPAGRARLADFARQITATGRVVQILIVGHTDRLGSDAYNQRLSNARAQAVRNFLIGQGLAPGLLGARGMGKREPVVECRPQARSALIACLAPNRRVELSTTFVQP